MATRTEDEGWMRRALAQAARGLGRTNPNPAVGCVIVRHGRLVGEAFHRRAGGPHAEALALERAGNRARGATLYVNLEPCSHTRKRTPPCAPRLVAAGIRRVVAAIRDPNPEVDGRGLSLLRRAGIAVEAGVLADAARLLNEPYVVSARERRPFVLLKAALSLDGRIATSARESRWITSQAQRRAARRLRRLYDAVAVGVGTVLADDPLLLPSPRVARPFHRVVFDSRLRLPLRSRLLRSATRFPLIVLCCRADARRRRALEARGALVLEGRARRGRVALSWALGALLRHGIRSLMVEGGSELLGTFLAERRFDQAALFRAPLLIGGRDSVPAFGGPGPRRLGGALALTPCSPLAPRLRPVVPCGAELWYPVR